MSAKASMVPIGQAVRLVPVSAFAKYLGWTEDRVEMLLRQLLVPLLWTEPEDTAWFNVGSLELALFVRLSPGKRDLRVVESESGLTEEDRDLILKPPEDLMVALRTHGVYNSTLTMEQMHNRLKEISFKARRVRALDDLDEYPRSKKQPKAER